MKKLLLIREGQDHLLAIVPDNASLDDAIEIANHFMGLDFKNNLPGKICGISRDYIHYGPIYGNPSSFRVSLEEEVGAALCFSSEVTRRDLLSWMIKAMRIRSLGVDYRQFKDGYFKMQKDELIKEYNMMFDDEGNLRYWDYIDKKREIFNLEWKR